MFPLYEQSAAIAGAPGIYMSPDAAARRMFYARTKLICPVCGSTQESRIETPGADICGECGRPVADSSTEGGGSVLRDEIDQLIDDLDGLTRRG
jgi:ribosomal protein L37AE/L43A